MTCTSQAHPGEEPCGFWQPGSEVGEPVTRSDLQVSTSKTTACTKKRQLHKLVTDQNVPCTRSTEANTMLNLGEYPTPRFQKGKMFPLDRDFEPPVHYVIRHN